MEFVDLGAQQARIRGEVEAKIAAVLAHGRYILGPEVAELEKKLAHFVGVRECLSVANGTDALQIALMALGVGAGDEVVVPSFSFFATAEVVVLVGARPVFADIDPLTYTLCPASFADRITSRTKAVIPVSLYGQCPDLDAISAIAQAHDVAVIEDGAQSFGAQVGAKRSCGLSLVGCTSFFPAKPLGCYGDGGALFTDDLSLARTLREVARHGETKRYHHGRIGLNSRLDTLQAAVLLVKLTIYEEEIALRQKVARGYTERLAAKSVGVPVVAEGRTSVFAQYTIRSADRDALAQKLRDMGIPTAVHYPKPLHHQAALAEFCEGVECPAAQEAALEVLSLPMHPYLSSDDLDQICDAID
jgi:UDP-2-acetamido-2-deoxy-ribo-hexuluronate aminotransferase